MESKEYWSKLTDWTPVNPVLALGRMFLDPIVSTKLKPEHVRHALQSHAIGNWGLVPMAIAVLNCDASRYGGPIISIFQVRDIRFLVVTKGNPPRTEVSV